MELSRQRLQPSLGETSHIPCPRCHGTGHIRDTESSALHILRILQEEAMKENTLALHAQVPVDVATYLLNEKRAEIHAIESRLKVDVVLIPNTHLETPNYEVERIRQDSSTAESDDTPSYQRMVAPVVEETKAAQKADTAKPTRPVPLVKGITPAQPAPITPRAEAVAPQAVQKVSIFRRMMGLFRRSETTTEAVTPPVNRAAAARRDSKSERDRNGRDGGREGGRNRSPRRDRPEGAKPEAAVKDTQAAKPPRDAKEVREPREPREPRPPRETREPREPREIREPRSERRPRNVEAEEVVKQDVAAPVMAGETETRTEGEGRSRRRRGGRGRGDRGERAPREQSDAMTESSASADYDSTPSTSTTAAMVGGVGAAAALTAAAALRGEKPSQQEMDYQAPVAATESRVQHEAPSHVAHDEPAYVAPTPAPIQHETPRYVAPEPETVLAPAPAPVVTAYQEPAKPVAPVVVEGIKPLPAELVVGSAAAAGLAMVETRSGAAQPAVYSDTPVARVPRQIVHDALPSVDDLIQVETHPVKRIAAAAAVVPETAEAAAIRRNLVPQAMPHQNEELKQVETRK
jgi:ribonuclease E